jgi:CheY-like chemotaxis protein
MVDGQDGDGQNEPVGPEPRTASALGALREFAAGRLRRAAPAARRILIVDDEAPVRMFVDRVLSGAGYDTAIACDGASALQEAANGGFDLVVTDLMMPEMNGSELARRLRQIEPHIKVLYLTGFSDHLFKEKVALWQDEAYLDKPCSVAGLLEAVALLATGSLVPSGRTS